MAKLYQRYQQQKQTKNLEQLERHLFHGVLRGVPAPDLAPAPWPDETTLIKFLRTLPVCVQELYGLTPVYEDRPLLGPCVRVNLHQ